MDSVSDKTLWVPDFRKEVSLFLPPTITFHPPFPSLFYSIPIPQRQSLPSISASRSSRRPPSCSLSDYQAWMGEQ